MYLILVEEGNLLLARRRNTGFEDGRLGLVSGKVEPGESLLAAMCREAAEEVGIAVAPPDLAFAHLLHRLTPGSEWVDIFFTATHWSGQPRVGEPEKCDELTWAPLDHLPRDTVAYIADVIAHVRAGRSYSEHGFRNT